MIINSRIITGIARINRNMLVLLPNFYAVYELKDEFSEYHFIIIEFRIVFFGIGLKFSWKNKNKKPLTNDTNI